MNARQEFDTSLSLGERILLYRRRNRLSQGQLAAQAGLPPGKLGRLERGEIGIDNLNVFEVRGLARAIETDEEALIADHERKFL